MDQRRISPKAVTQSNSGNVMTTAKLTKGISGTVASTRSGSTEVSCTTAENEGSHPAPTPHPNPADIPLRATSHAKQGKRNGPEPSFLTMSSWFPILDHTFSGIAAE